MLKCSVVHGRYRYTFLALTPVSQLTVTIPSRFKRARDEKVRRIDNSSQELIQKYGGETKPGGKYKYNTIKNVHIFPTDLSLTLQTYQYPVSHGCG